MDRKLYYWPATECLFIHWRRPSGQAYRVVNVCVHVCVYFWFKLKWNSKRYDTDLSKCLCLQQPLLCWWSESQSEGIAGHKTFDGLSASTTKQFHVKEYNVTRWSTVYRERRSRITTMLTAALFFFTVPQRLASWQSVWTQKSQATQQPYSA